MVTPEPAVSVVRVNPLPLPISICPAAGVLVSPVPPYPTPTAEPFQVPEVIAPPRATFGVMASTVPVAQVRVSVQPEPDPPVVPTGLAPGAVLIPASTSVMAVTAPVMALMLATA